MHPVSCGTLSAMPVMEKITLSIDNVGYGGNGFGRIDGKAVMVPGALPGETVAVAIRRRHQHRDDAELIEVLTPSAGRRVPDCPLAKRPPEDAGPRVACPGCTYQHADYALERQIKQDQLSALLQRLAGVTPVIEPDAASAGDQPLGYRNKLVWQAQRSDASIRLGYAIGRRDRVLDVAACPLAHPAINEAAAVWRRSRWFDKLRTGDRVTFRHTPVNGAIAWINAAPDNAVWLRENTSLGQISVPRQAFFQVNPVVSDRLIEWVRARIQESGMASAVDLYCGVGVFALTAAAAGIPKVLGIDQDRQAIRAARYNAENMGYSNMLFLDQPVHRALADRTGWTPADRTVAILDPPRAGLEPRTRERLVQWRPRRLLMIACAPDTLCRDLKILGSAGYRIDRLAWFDMFPRTAGFETAVWLHLDA